MSLSKAKIKYVQSLRIKKIRQTFRQFIVEGHKSIDELLHSDWEISELFCLNDFSPLPSYHGPLHMISRAEMERLSEHKSIPSVLAIVREKSFPVMDYTNGLHLVLDGIQDPGNLGTMVRIADWYALDSVLCSPDCADIYNAKAIAGSMGSFVRIPVHYQSLEDVFKDSPLPVYAAVMEGENVHRMHLKTPGFILIGNEGHGIRPELLQLPHRPVSIPRFGDAESLNAGIAAAILCDHFRRQE